MAKGSAPVRWTSLEWARIAHAIGVKDGKLQPIESGFGRALFEAQQLVLPPDRHRPLLSLQSGDMPATLAKLNEGALQAWMYDTPPPAAAATEPAPAPAAAVPEMAPAPAPAPAAPTPPPLLVSPPLAAFGDTLRAAVGILLEANTAETVARIQVALDATLTRLFAGIEAQLRDAIRHELGGVPSLAADAPPPAAPPAPAPPPAPVNYSPGHDAKVAALRPLVVDVVGLKGAQKDEVRRSFNGNTDVRFIDVDHAESWTPRGPHNIVVTRFSSRAADSKIKAAGHKPILVATPSEVVGAISRLHMQRELAP